MELKKALLSDFESFYSLKCEISNIRWTGHSVAPDKDNLYGWFKKALNNPNRIIYLFWNEKVCLGYLYVDFISETEREMAYGISETQQGKGYASLMIADCLELLRNEGVNKAVAYISEKNIASQHVAKKNGLKKTNEHYFSELPLHGGESKFEKWEIYL